MAEFQIKFKFESPELYVFEIKRTDLSADAPIEQKYHWFSFDRTSGALERLKFLSMAIDGNLNSRFFDQAKFDFNSMGGKFRKITGESFALQNTTAQPLPVGLSMQVSQFFEE